MKNKAKQEFDWKLEEQLAGKDIADGKVKKFKTTKDAIKWLKS